MADSPTRTIVYIDGFNFHYGVVRGTPWKWLDPEMLFRTLLAPRNDVVRVKYFTAHVQPSPADPNVHERQAAYLRALKAHCPALELHLGHFLRHRVRMEHANPPPATVQVWKNEEKGSDVNLALNVLNDAWLDAYDCAVIVSNDSDLAEALRLVQRRELVIRVENRRRDTSFTIMRAQWILLREPPFAASIDTDGHGASKVVAERQRLTTRRFVQPRLARLSNGKFRDACTGTEGGFGNRRRRRVGGIDDAARRRTAICAVVERGYSSRSSSPPHPSVQP